MDIPEGPVVQEQKRRERERQGEVLVLDLVLSVKIQRESRSRSRFFSSESGSETFESKEEQEAVQAIRLCQERRCFRKADERRGEAEGPAVSARAALHGEQGSGGGDEEEDVFAIQARTARLLGV